MPAVPSIKGRVLAAVVEDIEKLRSSGALRDEELGRWLRPDDVEFLRRPLQPAEWYDVAMHERLCLLLRDVEGGGRSAYLKARGARAAERLLDAGLYAQFEFLNRMNSVKLTDPAQRAQAWGRDLKLLTTLSSSILSFSRWEVERDPDFPSRHRIEIREAAAFHDVLGWITEGFINRMAALHAGPDLFAFERVARERVRYRMRRDF